MSVNVEHDYRQRRWTDDAGRLAELAERCDSGAAPGTDRGRHATAAFLRRRIENLCGATD